MKKSALILLINLLFTSSCASVTNSNSSVTEDGCVAMQIVVNDALFVSNKVIEDYDSFKKDDIITSSVKGSTSPKNNNESNFGKGYEYEIISDQIIYVKYGDDIIEFLRAN